jgi:hypothetical protein
MSSIFISVWLIPDSACPAWACHCSWVHALLFHWPVGTLFLNIVDLPKSTCPQLNSVLLQPDLRSGFSLPCQPPPSPTFLFHLAMYTNQALNLQFSCLRLLRAGITGMPPYLASQVSSWLFVSGIDCLWSPGSSLIFIFCPSPLNLAGIYSQKSTYVCLFSSINPDRPYLDLTASWEAIRYGKENRGTVVVGLRTLATARDVGRMG